MALRGQIPAGGNLDVQLFGPVSVRVDGRPIARLRTRKDLWLLALLALRRGADVDRAWLAATLWPEAEEHRAAYNLRRSLSELRRGLHAAAGVLQSRTQRTLSLDVEVAAIDVAQFDHATACGDAPSLQRAVDLYRGPLLEGCLEDWAVPEREAREAACLMAIETLAGLATDRGDPAAAMRYWRRAVSLDPLRESSRRGLIQALVAHGSRSDAVLAYREYRLLLRRELNTDPSPETTALFEAIRRGGHRGEGRPSRASSDAARPCAASTLRDHTPRVTLPQPITQLIGRDELVQSGIAALPATRLLTLVGSGGVGKTRLAIETAATAADEYADGARFVDLVPLPATGYVWQAIASALQIREESGGSLAEKVIELLSTRQMLLVMDNCEHVIDEISTATARILSDCPGVTVIATSRQPLGLPGETVRRVPSLSLPPHPDEPIDFRVGASTGAGADTLESDAVKLFIERARQADGAFEVSAPIMQAVEEICRSLDGIPLAIELAAARVRGLPPERIAARLDDRMTVLMDTGGGPLKRHQTIHAAIDWSYRLLADDEASLFRRLAVFSGSFTLEAAEQICCEDVVRAAPHPTAPPRPVMDLLIRLVDKSLVQREDGAPRYRLLSTVRAYALERLQGTGDDRALRDSHAAWFLAVARDAYASLHASAQPAAVERVDAERDNLRGAFSHLLDSNEEDALRLATALCWLRGIQGRYTEATEAVRRALARYGERRTMLRAEALIELAYIAYPQGQFAIVAELAKEALDLARYLGDLSATARALRMLADAVACLEGTAAARPIWDEGIAAARACGNRAAEARCLNGLGNHYLTAASHLESLAHFDAALSILRDIGDATMEAIVLDNVGRLRRLRGDYEGALAIHAQSLACCRRYRDRVGATATLTNIAVVEYCRGELERARSLVDEVIEFSRSVGLYDLAADALDVAANVARIQRDLPAAAQLADDALRYHRSAGLLEGVATSLQGAGLVALERGDYGSSLEFVTESLSLATQIGWIAGVVSAIAALVRVDASTDPRRAARLYGTLVRLQHDTEIALPLPERRSLETTMERTRAALGPLDFARLREYGAANGVATDLKRVAATAAAR